MSGVGICGNAVWTVSTCLNHQLIRPPSSSATRRRWQRARQLTMEGVTPGMLSDVSPDSVEVSREGHRERGREDETH